MPATKPKRPSLPESIDLIGVSPGDDAFGEAGAYAPATGNVIVTIEDDPLGLFTVSKISIFDLERDPDGGPTLILVPAGSVDGAGPVAVEQDEAVEPKIHFKAPQQPTQLTFSATAVIAGDGWPAPVRIPVEATIAGISIRAAIRRLTIVQGGHRHRSARGHLPRGTRDGRIRHVRSAPRDRHRGRVRAGQPRRRPNRPVLPHLPGRS